MRSNASVPVLGLLILGWGSLAGAQEPPATQLTFQGGMEPGWSPDGTQIVFSSWRAGNTDLWVMPATGEPATRLTTDPQEEGQPSWSPDGASIAFNRYNIWVMPAAGGPGRQLTDWILGAVEPSWSPDGTQIAFCGSPFILSGRSNHHGGRQDGAGADANFDLYVMPSNGQWPNRITFHPMTDANPSWSPDGGRIAFASDQNGNSDIWEISPQGGEATQLTFHPFSDWSPAWSPDGSQIAFVSNRSGNIDIWVMPAGGGAETQLTTHGGYDLDPAWSPDGTRIAFTSERSGSFEVWMMTVSTTSIPDPHSVSWGAIKARYR